MSPCQVPFAKNIVVLWEVFPTGTEYPHFKRLPEVSWNTPSEIVFVEFKLFALESLATSTAVPLSAYTNTPPSEYLENPKLRSVTFRFFKSVGALVVNPFTPAPIHPVFTPSNPVAVFLPLCPEIAYTPTFPVDVIALVLS